MCEAKLSEHTIRIIELPYIGATEETTVSRGGDLNVGMRPKRKPTNITGIHVIEEATVVVQLSRRNPAPRLGVSALSHLPAKASPV